MAIGFVFLLFPLFYSYVESFNNTTESDRVMGGVPANIQDFPYQNNSFKRLYSLPFNAETPIGSKGQAEVKAEAKWDRGKRNLGDDLQVFPMDQDGVADGTYDLSNLAMESQTGWFMCGASIIHELWAISASHCVDGRTPDFLRLRSGSSYQLTGGTLHQVQMIIMHPYYNRFNMDYDVSVLKVFTPFTYSDVSRGMPMATQTPSPGTPAVVSGWGTFRPDGSSPFQLQQVTIYIVDYYICKQRQWLTPRMLCAGFSYGGRGSCHGDSGGPLVAEGKLVGIVSWGTRCADPYYPEVYTNVAVVHTWVTSIIQTYS